MASHEKVEKGLVRLLEKDSMGAFVGFLRDTVGERWGEQVDEDVWLKFVEFR